MLARIYGIFSVKIEKLKPVHLILMGNSMKTQKVPDADGNLKGMKPEYVFDLKGSLVNREVKHPKKRGDTLKDINLLKIKIDENIVKFDTFTKEHIMKHMT